MFPPQSAGRSFIPHEILKWNLIFLLKHYGVLLGFKDDPQRDFFRSIDEVGEGQEESFGISTLGR